MGLGVYDSDASGKYNIGRCREGRYGWPGETRGERGV